MVGGTMTERQYVYKITKVVKVVDGDSYWLRVDVGFRQENLINVRLAGYDCPEARKGTSNEKEKAIEARAAVNAYFNDMAGQLWIQTEKDPDSFGRWLGDIWREFPTGSQAHLGNYLALLKLASVWPTRWREEYDAA